MYVLESLRLTNLQCKYKIYTVSKGDDKMSIVKKLSKDMIIQKAFEYADQHSLEDLSMRKLSKALNVQAMSLYNHIEHKDALIHEMIDVLVQSFDFDVSDTWQVSMKLRARKMKDELLKHPWATIPLISGWHVKDNFLNFFNRSIGVLKNAGFSYGQSNQITSMIDSYVYGYVLRAQHYPIEEENYQATAQAYENFFDKHRLPYLLGLSEDIRLGTYSGIIDFELGLDSILSGIETTIKKGD